MGARAAILDCEASICNRELAAAPTPPPPPSRWQIIAAAAASSRGQMLGRLPKISPIHRLLKLCPHSAQHDSLTTRLPTPGWEATVSKSRRSLDGRRRGGGRNRVDVQRENDVPRITSPQVSASRSTSPSPQGWRGWPWQRRLCLRALPECGEVLQRNWTDGGVFGTPDGPAPPDGPAAAPPGVAGPGSDGDDCDRATTLTRWSGIASEELGGSIRHHSHSHSLGK